MRPVRPRNHKRKHSVPPAMTLGFLMLALLTIGIVFQVPTALGESDNPLSALWDAIFDLQSKDKDLQEQIDELTAEREALLAPEPEFVSDPYAAIAIAGTEDGRTLIHITAGNNGPDRAAGVKLTAFYMMPLFEINSIEGDLCEHKSRGIIECTIGTLEEDQEIVIAVDATARESGKANTWTVDISTTTDDADYINNHVTYDFETGSGEPIEILQVEQPAEEEVIEEEPEATETEQGGESINSTETEGQQESAGNQTSAETEAIEDSDSSSSSAEGSEDGQSSEPEESPSEESATGESSESGSQESGSDQLEDSGDSSEESESVSSSQP